MAVALITAGTGAPSLGLAVYYKWNWADTWRFVPYWEPVSATHSAAPTIGQATFKVRYGYGFWEDFNSMTGGNMLSSFAYCYVQIRGVAAGGELILWTGIIPAEQFKVFGQSGSVITTDQVLQAYGLDVLLDSRLDGFYIRPIGGGSLVWPEGRLPTFNSRHEYGGDIIGNRSDWDSEADAYIFDTETGDVWSNFWIADYLLWFYQQDNGPFFSLSPTPAILQALDQIKEVCDLNSMTLRQALNTLISRSRGLAWTYTVDFNNNVELIPFSLLDAPVKVGDMTMPANEQKVAVDYWQSQLSTQVEIHQDITHTYDRIIVRGAKMKSCCTLSLVSGTLEKGWTDAEETVYKNAAKDTAGYGDLTGEEKAELNDKYRSADRFKRVFATFRVPRDWNWKIIDDFVNPHIDTLGFLDPAKQAEYWNADKRILNFLPFSSGTDYGNTQPVDRNPTGAEPEFRKPFVLVLDEEGSYQYAEKLDPAAASIRPLAREMGIEMRFRPNYLAALNHWSGAEPGVYDDEISQTGNAVDYEDILLTAFFQTDQYVRLVHDFNNCENKRILIIDLPDCELWYIAPGTVFDVNAAGVPIEYGGLEKVIRDDRPRLRAVMAAAIGWYGRRHNKVSIRLQAVDPALPVGTMIVNTDIAGVGAAGSVVTSVAWNFATKEPSTVLKTDFAQLDFSVITRRGGSSSGGGETTATPTPRVAAKKLAFLESQIKAIKAELNKSPLRIEPATVSGGGSLSIKIFAVQSEAAGDGVYNCYEQTLDATEWDDTTGAPKFDDKNTTSVEVLNLAEHNPESEYVAHLAAGDLIAAWQKKDDEGTWRWAGVPFRQANADRTRIAYCKEDAGNGLTLACYLDKDSTGTEITVHFAIAQGGTDLNEAAPRLKDGDPVYVQKINDGTNDYWRCTQTLNASEDCDCYQAP